MKLQFEIEHNQKTFEPGSKLSGKLIWDLEQEAKHIVIAMLWYTTGKGTRDTETVEQMKVLQPGRHGERFFDFKAPAGPLSFSGSLISLEWTLEAVAYPSKETEQYNFILSTSGEEISLNAHAAE